jgi:hypothetical protein
MGDKLSNDEYSDFRSKIITLKEKYKKDIQNAILLDDKVVQQYITSIFTKNVKELYEKYITFVGEYLEEEVKYLRGDVEFRMNSINDVFAHL